MLIVFFQWMSICLLANTPHEGRFDQLLKQDRSRDLVKRLFEAENREKIKKQCRYELASNEIPFSCYKIKKHKIVDEVCIKNAHRLLESDFYKIQSVSLICKAHLILQKEKLLYIKAAEHPEEIVFRK